MTPRGPPARLSHGLPMFGVCALINIAVGPKPACSPDYKVTLFARETGPKLPRPCPYNNFTDDEEEQKKG